MATSSLLTGEIDLGHIDDTPDTHKYDQEHDKTNNSDDDSDTSGSYWKSSRAQKTRLYFPSSTNNIANNETTNKNHNAHVLSYDEQHHRLRLIQVDDDDEDDDDTTEKSSSILTPSVVPPHIVDSFSPNDVIGADLRIDIPDDGSSSSSQAAYLNIYCYPRASERPFSLQRCFGPSSQNGTEKGEEEDKCTGYRHEHHRTFRIQDCFDFTEARALVRAIRRLANLGHYGSSSSSSSGTTTTTRYLVVVNPYSGTGKGMSVYESTVRKMLEECGVEHDLFVTQYAGHANERMTEGYNRATTTTTTTTTTGENEGEDVRDVAEYDGIVAMGGDGIMYEMMQALWKRGDAEILMKRLRIGIVGCGTSNGLAAGLLYRREEKYHFLESTFLICKGNTSKMDLSSYRTETKQYVSFLTFTWAMIAEIDIESECIRFAGVLRNDIWGAWRVLNLRRYRAKFSYLPPLRSDDDNNNINNNDNDRVSGSATNDFVSASDLPSLHDPVPSSWKTIEANFLLFWACQQTHAASNTHQTPDCTLTDGVFNVLFVREPCSRLEIAKILLGLETASHVSNKRAEFIKCLAFRLEPITPGSFNDLDGEVIESGPVQAHVMPAAINVFTG